LIVLTLATSRAFPQATRPASGPRGDGAMLLDRAREMVDELKLSEDQKKKVADVFDKAKDQFKSMRQELENVAPRDRMERMREFFGSVREDVASVLTDEQKHEFQKKMDGLRDRMREAGGPGGIPDRLRDNLQKLDLSDEQKAKIKDLFEDVQAKMQAIRQEHQGEMEQARDKVREVFEGTREKLNGILTESQRNKLRELMGAQGGPTSRPAGAAGQRGAAGERPRAPRAGTRDPKAAGGEMTDSMMGESPSNPRKRDTAAARKSPATAPAAAAVGATVPDLQLRKIDGNAIALSSFKGRPVVLEFGSYTCPSFRQRAGGMEQLKKEYGARATFLVVYTAEAHPTGGWEADRNKEEKIFMDAHTSLDERKAAANKAREALKITVPIVLDDMDDSVAKVFGAKANSLVMVKDGKVVARQEWADPQGAKRLLDNALKTE
jgi:Spy/CpxP family protein refolding chaperone/peroxiredoxin